MFNINKSNVLNFGNRKEVFDFISKNPGLHLSELSRKINIPKSTLYYHLKHLRKNDLIIGKKQGRYMRFYVKNSLSNTEKELLNILRQNCPLNIVLYLLKNPDSSQRDISRGIKKHPTTVAHHLTKLNKIDALEIIPFGNKLLYNLRYPNYINRLIIKYNDIIDKQFFKFFKE